MGSRGKILVCPWPAKAALVIRPLHMWVNANVLPIIFRRQHGDSETLGLM
jgi:hypothetical protein